MSDETAPLRFVLGEFDNAIEVWHPGDEHPSLVITSGGDYLTGTGAQPPVAAKGRSAAAAKTGSVTERELQDGTVTARTLATGAVTEAVLSHSVLTRLLPEGRNPFDRAQHEGVQSLDTTVDGEARFALTKKDRKRLHGVEPEATRNQPDDFLLNRANHTGRLQASEVEGLGSAAYADVQESAQLLSGGVPTAAAVREYVRTTVDAVDTTIPRKSITGRELAFECVTAEALKPRIIRNEHIAEDAEISLGSLVVNPLQRGLHTGTQPATTITGLGPLATIPQAELLRLSAEHPVIAALLEAADV